MTVRGNFTEQLEELKSKILNLGELAKTAIDEAITSLKEQDVEKALKIIKNDKKINSLEDEINDKAILLIAKEQPVATDLRRLIVTLRVTNDLERIGDLAVNIAKSVIRIGDKPVIKPLEELPKMASITQNMVGDVLKAYYDEDVASAKRVADTDDQVDALHGHIIEELLKIMTKDSENTSQVTQLAFICRSLERVADHTTNISEGIIYLVEGKFYDLNS